MSRWGETQDAAKMSHAAASTLLNDQPMMEKLKIPLSVTVTASSIPRDVFAPTGENLTLSAFHESSVASAKLHDEFVAHPLTVAAILAVSTPMERFSTSASSTPTTTKQHQYMTDKPPSRPLALKDRSNMSPNDSNMELSASASRAKRSHQNSTTPLGRFSLANDAGADKAHDSSKKPKIQTSSAKRPKRSDAQDSDSESSSRKKSRPMLAGSVQLVRSSALLLGSTLQNAFTSTLKLPTPASNKLQRNLRESMSPPKRKLPTVHDVAEIRKLVHQYTLLDPLDRQDSKQSRAIQCMTGYTLNPPLVSLFGSTSIRSPIQTRSGKVETLLKLRIDLAELDACKSRDQALTEACTQCRYQRDGCKFRFVHVPSNTIISAEQYEARYLVMLQQVCATRSEYWSQYFGRLYKTTTKQSVSTIPFMLDTVEEEMESVEDFETNPGHHVESKQRGVCDCGTSTRVLVDGDDWMLCNGCSPTSNTTEVLETKASSEKIDRGSPSAYAVVMLHESKALSSNELEMDAETLHNNVSLSATVGSCVSASSLATGQVLFPNMTATNSDDESAADGSKSTK